MSKKYLSEGKKYVEHKFGLWLDTVTNSSYYDNSTIIRSIRGIIITALFCSFVKKAKCLLHSINTKSNVHTLVYL